MITKEELKNLSDLSRLTLTEKELEKYAKEMADIIKLMDTIGDSNFEYNPLELQNSVPFSSLRKDEVKAFSDMEKIVEGGPEIIENMFVVPKVVD